jgi:hypothetical protein
MEGWHEWLLKPADGHDNQLHVAQGKDSRLSHWLKDEKNFLMKGKEAAIVLKLEKCSIKEYYEWLDCNY